MPEMMQLLPEPGRIGRLIEVLHCCSVAEGMTWLILVAVSEVTRFIPFAPKRGFPKGLTSGIRDQGDSTAKTRQRRTEASSSDGRIG
jgi:hypothetical protein